MSHASASADHLHALASLLAEAHREPARTVDATRFAGLDRDQACEVQHLTRQLLSETAPAAKVAVSADGSAICAPFYGSTICKSGFAFEIPARGLIGIEVEIAVRLARTIGPETARADAHAVLDAIESFHVGVEIVGSRFDDRLAAGPFGQLADNINGAGYVWSPHPWTRGADIADLRIEVSVDGAPFWQGTGAAPFGELLTPILAVARNAPAGFDPLQQGMLVTTGALCGLIEIRSPGRIEARIVGADPVHLTLQQSPVA